MTRLALALALAAGILSESLTRVVPGSDGPLPKN